MNPTLLLLSIIFGIVYCAIFSYLMFTIFCMVSGAPYVPTKRSRCHKMIEMSALKSKEKMTDLGSGDGRLICIAAKTGAECMGVEINPWLFALSKIKLKALQIPNATVFRKNMWNVSLSDIDVLTLYLIPHKMNKMKQKIFSEMKPGSRVVSHGFSFPDWQFVKKDDMIYLYVV